MADFAKWAEHEKVRLV